ncbi:ribonuclease P protein subunit POP4 [Methanococcus voltae]|jgi:ribonuclease P protein subunit POP4|uniref:Ribonuclease P protein component 1 n=1 Tax=Methanococcus voltae TaxID=2188 RepID=A0A8J7USU0_METVO|nr:ribonuclease P protein component 1 [Methanococcus voltae]MBP2200918.1 ribonuclease P protein subunit POP4 [Methanococcus voltae]
MKISKDILRHELIGLSVEVIQCNNKQLIGKKGVVVDETRNTLTIESKVVNSSVTNEQKNEYLDDDVQYSYNEFQIPKDIAVFQFDVTTSEGLFKVKIDGNLLVGRPEDRLKRKFKKIYPY